MSKSKKILGKLLEFSKEKPIPRIINVINSDIGNFFSSFEKNRSQLFVEIKREIDSEYRTGASKEDINTALKEVLDNIFFIQKNLQSLKK